MIGFVRRLWSRDHRRNIFTFFDGTRRRRVDPLQVGAALERECPRYADHLELLADDGPPIPGNLADDVQRQKTEAIADLVRSTRAAFKIEPLSGTGGLTEAETLKVLNDYLVFMCRLADAATPFGNSRPRDAPSPPPTTPPSAASGSAAT